VVKLGGMGGLGEFWAKASTGAMNREVNGAIVCCGCYHSLDTRSWVLRKMAPFYSRGNLRI